MSKVFLDTVGLLALWDTSDQWHEAAEDAFSKLTQSRSLLLTSSFVLLECGNAAAKRPYRSAVDRLRERLESCQTLVAPSADDWQQAWHAYSRGEAGEAGIVDHVSFVIMRRLEIEAAFTNDRHFRAAGFNTLF